MARIYLTLSLTPKVREQVPRYAAAMLPFGVNVLEEKENRAGGTIELVLDNPGFPTTRTVINLAYDYFEAELLSFRI